MTVMRRLIAFILIAFVAVSGVAVQAATAPLGAASEAVSHEGADGRHHGHGLPAEASHEGHDGMGCAPGHCAIGCGVILPEYAMQPRERLTPVRTHPVQERAAGVITSFDPPPPKT